ncbi:unnamed protein product (macronuclear) [Paramecium tetraurelia]|uniref:Uncharacterized protein n=1 Tax=Paramecium tetraurelia TaxID=5888 RepID=A0EIC6_PARTE|nr:uncharacterized protein GSPATT00027396001 [Paramecium tetraurelia]CAK95067.1 unnamed protein product [Paramecium tetraurelia]|eukprot:XP_001462440.1 hypothetical protein (macronuclear) [Paramecium tetraurelia strain d4-2]
MNEQEKLASPVTKKVSEDEIINEKEVLQALSYINFKLLNTLILQNKQENNVIILFKALLTIFQESENWIPKNIKDWATIQRTIGHTSKFIQMLQNFKKYYITECKIQQTQVLLQEVHIQKLSQRANNLLKIVKSLLKYYSNPFFNQSLHEDSQLTYQFQNEPPLSPIKNSNLLDQDSEIIMQELIKKEKLSTVPNEMKRSCQISKVRSRSPTTASSGSKSRTIQSCQPHRLSIPVGNPIRQLSSSQQKSNFTIKQFSKTINNTASLKSSGIYFRERSQTNTQNKFDQVEKSPLQQTKQQCIKESLFTKKSTLKNNK